jgi:hypothetical protein
MHQIFKDNGEMHNYNKCTVAAHFTVLPAALVLTFPAGGAFGREDAMEVVDAVDLVVKVHREGDPVQAIVAHAASAHTRTVASVRA